MPQVIERSKRYKKAAEKAITNPVGIDEAVDAVKAFPPTKFDQSVELIFSLGIDPKQADQGVRGSISLPHGIGKMTMAQCKELAKEKVKDLNAFDLDAAAKVIAGTARSMGITVEG